MNESFHIFSVHSEQRGIQYKGISHWVSAV